MRDFRGAIAIKICHYKIVLALDFLSILYFQRKFCIQV